MGIVGLTLRFVWILVLYFQMHMHISAVKSLALRVKPSIINTKARRFIPCFPNLLMTEIQIDGPLQCIVSDMTAFYVKGIYYELTLYMDLWNNEIVSHSLSSKRGDRMTYISGLEDLIALKKQYPEYEMILHSDQGSVYTSKAFNDLLPMYSITHSMSRAGTPTDNAAMEAINGWIKAEMFTDFHVTGERPVVDEVKNIFTSLMNSVQLIR